MDDILRNISCKPYYIQDTYNDIANCTDPKELDQIYERIGVDKTYTQFKRFINRPCINFAMTYQQKVTEKKIKNMTNVINGKNVTLYYFNPEFWIYFLTDEIKIVSQEQAYTLKSFLAEVGGYIGMFLGISFMQVNLLFPISSPYFQLNPT